MPSSSGHSHKDFMSIGYVPEPYGYIQVPAPPSDWSVVIDGHTITPRLIQKTLRRCHAAGVDLWYVAQRLSVGEGAIGRFLVREKTIPETLAKRFYELFTSGEPLPKAPPAPVLDDDESESTDEEGYKYKPIKFREPDFDSRRLGKALIEARYKRGWTREEVAEKIGTVAASLSPVESGQVKWVTNKNCLVYRLCDLYGIDVQKYELKPRMDYQLFQSKIISAKVRREVRQHDLAYATGISRYLLHTYLNPRQPRNNPVYLEEEMRTLMDVLGVDPESVILKRKKEVANAKNQHD